MLQKRSIAFVLAAGLFFCGAMPTLAAPEDQAESRAQPFLTSVIAWITDWISPPGDPDILLEKAKPEDAPRPENPKPSENEPLTSSEGDSSEYGPYIEPSG